MHGAFRATNQTDTNSSSIFSETAIDTPPENLSGLASTPGTKYSLLYNPLNYMFSDLSQSPSKNQKISLPTEREHSTIPKGVGRGNWEYPSPQQMYNALLRKGYADTDVTAVESMVSVHNSLNEGAWAEIVKWERIFAGGLGKGWKICQNGEDQIKEITFDDELVQPSLLSFMGRPKDMTPKAAIFQLLGILYPAKFGLVFCTVSQLAYANSDRIDPPFDRHDWLVQREYGGKSKTIRYIIDYYSHPNGPNGEPVFSLDVRPAITPLAAAERVIRWSCNFWHQASGAEARQKSARGNIN